MDAILDAASAVIRESGLGGLTVHGVAERAGTSIGSMYHFFPDLDAVIGGLIDRHLKRFVPLVSALKARDPKEWSRMSAAAAVDAIVAPIFSYLRRNPDVLALNAAPETGFRFGRRKDDLKNAGVDIVERILAARGPSVKPEPRRARAAVMVGAMEGVALAYRGGAPQVQVVNELRRAMTAYLEVLEGARQGSSAQVRRDPPGLRGASPGARPRCQALAAASSLSSTRSVSAAATRSDAPPMSMA